MGDRAGIETTGDEELFGDVVTLIERARTRAAVAVNSELVMLYWSVGKRIREEVLGGERAAYGEQVVRRLATQLTERYGRGWSQRGLERMVRFADVYSSREIATPLAPQLTWTNICELLTIADQRKRDFYLRECARGRWSKRTLRERIGSRLYERTRSGAAMPGASDDASDDARIVLRDPYVLDFLGLPSEHSEAEFERAILDQMQRFLLELGAGFAFVQRQKRMPVDGRDYRLDLLMYHINLRCYVAIELKTRALEPSDFGQMTLYLRWLVAYENREGDATPLGIVLCTQRGPEQVRLFGLDEGEVRAASYVIEPVRASLERALGA